MVLARRNAVATQEKFVPRLRASEMVGKAVLVTLPSRAERRRGRHIAVNDRQKPRPLFHLIAGRAEGREDDGEGGIVVDFSSKIDGSLLRAGVVATEASCGHSDDALVEHGEVA
jgi:hypothetical protein